jgi:hypothetical protein
LEDQGVQISARNRLRDSGHTSYCGACRAVGGLQFEEHGSSPAPIQSRLRKINQCRHFSHPKMWEGCLEIGAAGSQSRFHRGGTCPVTESSQLIGPIAFVADLQHAHELIWLIGVGDNGLTQCPNRLMPSRSGP